MVLSHRLPRVMFCDVDSNYFSDLVALQQDPGVVDSQIIRVEGLRNERPILEAFVGGLVVEHRIETGDETQLLDEK